MATTNDSNSNDRAQLVLAFNGEIGAEEQASLLGMGHSALGEWFGHRRTERCVRERDGPDALAST